MNIVLTGFMGTGKTSVGRALAAKAGMSFMDIDEQIARDTGLSIQQIFAGAGEGHFRELESRAVELVSLLDRFVIATGGGVVLNQNNMKALRRNGVIVNLMASVDSVLERTKPWQDRPLLIGGDPREKIEALLAEREKFYGNCDLRVDTTGVGVDEVADKIIVGLQGRMPPQK